MNANKNDKGNDRIQMAIVFVVAFAFAV